MASVTNQSAAGMDNVSVGQMRMMAMVQRRTMPPRCNPITIVLIVLSLGMMFIGLTMTVIAHWPGSSSIGENPLKIAGPILLVFGFVAFVVMLGITCFLNSREKKKWMQSVNNLAASRLTVNQSYTSLSGTQHKQPPPHMKTDPYGPADRQPQYDPVDPYRSPADPYPADVETGYRHPASNDSQDSAMIEKQNYMRQVKQEEQAALKAQIDEEDLPEPVRISKKPLPHRRRNTDEDLEDVDRTGQDIGAEYQTSVPLMQHQNETEPYPPVEDERDHQKKKKKKSKGKKSKAHRSDAVEAPVTETEALMDPGPYHHEVPNVDPPVYRDFSHGYQYTVDTNIDSDPERYPPEHHGSSSRIAVPDSPRLRIELRVPSGSKINISQGEEKPFRPPVAPKPKRNHNKSSSSLETNI